MNRPRHHLQHLAVERRQKAVAIRRARTVWMDQIVVLPRTHDGEELLKRVAPLGPPRLVWRQVARVKMQQLSFAAKRTEIPAPTQVGRWIDLLRPGIWRRKKVGVSRPNVFGHWALAMTPVAVSLPVDNVAAQSNQPPVPSFVGEGNRRDR